MPHRTGHLVVGGDALYGEARARPCLRVIIAPTATSSPQGALLIPANRLRRHRASDDHDDRVRRDHWDLLVVGGGTAGIVGARTAARLGARVLLVETARPGGDCLWTGCVPSKALLAAAAAAGSARSAGRLGIEVPVVDVQFDRVMEHVRSSIAHIAPIDSTEALEAAGVHVLRGRAMLTGPRTVSVDGRLITFHQALLATGASPFLPPVPGLADAAPLTSDTVWELTSLPQRLSVLGGGSIGCELGQAFARLGTQVTIIEGERRILPHEDPDASAVLATSLARDGVTLRTGVSVVSVETSAGGGAAVRLADGSSVPHDRLLVTVGRRPRTESLGLEAAGVDIDARGFVIVDPRLRTTNPRIWAAGDLTGHPQFTHVAGVHGSTAATNALLGLRRPVSTTAVPRVTFTQPEVAAVGLPTDGSQPGLRVIRWPNEHVDRAVAEDCTEGFTTILVDRRGIIRGATVVGPRAGETLGELALAVTRRLRTRHLAATTHPYPTFNDGLWNAVIADVQGRLAAPRTARLVKAMGSARRWALDRPSPQGEVSRRDAVRGTHPDDGRPDAGDHP